MLFRDFLSKHAVRLMEQQVLFDWSWPDARYELKINTHLEVTHRRIDRYGNKGSWTQVQISDLRRFRVLTASVTPRKLVNSNAVIRVITDDGNSRTSYGRS